MPEGCGIPRFGDILSHTLQGSYGKSQKRRQATTCFYEQRGSALLQCDTAVRVVLRHTLTPGWYEHFYRTHLSQTAKREAGLAVLAASTA